MCVWVFASRDAAVCCLCSASPLPGAPLALSFWWTPPSSRAQTLPYLGCPHPGNQPFCPPWLLPLHPAEHPSCPCCVRCWGFRDQGGGLPMFTKPSLLGKYYILFIISSQSSLFITLFNQYLYRAFLFTNIFTHAISINLHVLGTMSVHFRIFEKPSQMQSKCTRLVKHLPCHFLRGH